MEPTARIVWQPVPGLCTLNAIGLSSDPIEGSVNPITIWKGVGKHGSRNQQG